MLSQVLSPVLGQSAESNAEPIKGVGLRFVFSIEFHFDCCTDHANELVKQAQASKQGKERKGKK